jgi:hypothetical protein
MGGQVTVHVADSLHVRDRSAGIGGLSERALVEHTMR